MDVEEMQGELELFKSAGGATICELSCTGVRCSPQQASSLAQLSRLTGVNIVHATGFYCHRFLDDAVHRMSVEEMTDAMLEEVHHLHCIIYVHTRLYSTHYSGTPLLGTPEMRTPFPSSSTSLGCISSDTFPFYYSSGVQI